MPNDIRAFTISSNIGLLRQLRTKASLISSLATSGSSVTKDSLDAVWDTGATATCISEKVARDMGLRSIGKVNVNGVDGTTVRDRYIVSLVLPNKVGFSDIVVNDGNLGDIDVLIGMDIISTGDFAITNKGGKTTFTFQHPSSETIDFVKKLKTKDIIGTHGRGKRKRK